MNHDDDFTVLLMARIKALAADGKTATTAGVNDLRQLTDNVFICHK